ncbi:MAG: VWA domain-containing protein, partial [Chloroflexi bacterium]|nr:VWA domain-containing protein [Chloroflexota bacterium]
MDPGAKGAFDELVKSLQQRVADTSFKDISEQLKSMTPEQRERLKEMVRDLNDMLREKAEGGKPAFDQFMQRWGDSFGGKPPQSLDELIEGLQERMSQMQSLLRSMSPQNRESLRQLLESVFGEGEMKQELAELAANLEDLHPTGVQGREFPFHGDEPVALEQAMELVEQLHKMDDLERQVRKSQQNSTLEDLDRDLVRDVLGEEAAHHYDQLNQLTDMLEQAGYIRKVGARYELTPKGMRRIGQKALEEIFLYLKKDRLGQHRARHQGQGGDRLEETKLY